MCRLAGVSRAGFYRRFLKREPRTEEVELRAEMQRIVLAQPRILLPSASWDWCANAHASANCRT
jgi:hypothetical protein